MGNKILHKISRLEYNRVHFGFANCAALGKISTISFYMPVRVLFCKNWSNRRYPTLYCSATWNVQELLVTRNPPETEIIIQANWLVGMVPAHSLRVVVDACIKVKYFELQSKFSSLLHCYSNLEWRAHI